MEIKKKNSYDTKVFTKEELLDFLYTKSLCWSKNILQQCKEHGIILKYNLFSEKEDEVIKEHIDEFCKEKSIDLEGFKEYLRPSDNRKSPNDDIEMKNLSSKIAIKLKHRMLTQVYEHIRNVYSPYYTNEKYTVDDDKKLLMLVNGNGTKFSTFQNELKRTKFSINERYRCLKDIKVKNMTKSFIRKIEKVGFPTTAEEYANLSKVTGLSVKCLKLKIKQYINGKAFDLDRDVLKLIEISLSVLENNFACSLLLAVENIMEKLEEAEVENGEEIEKFVERFIRSKVDKNLDVMIEIEDICFRNIYVQLEINYETVVTIFKSLKKEYKWRNYNDILNTSIELIKEYLNQRIIESV